MALTQLSASGLGTTIDMGTPHVQIAKTWGNWIDMPYIQPLNASLVAAPSIGQATFIWRYGLIRHEDSTQQIWETPLNIAGYFVRIQLYVRDTTIVMWAGIIQDNEFVAFGSSSGNPAGDQKITAYTLDYCLDRIAIIGAWTTDGYINTCPPFNLRREWIPHPVGNKAATLDENNVPRFGSDKKLWTALDVINYLLAHYAEPAGLTITLGGQVDALTTWHYVWQLEGLSIRQALDKLIDRRRGLGWRINSDGNFLEIVIYTTIETDINFPETIVPEHTIGGITIPESISPAITIQGNGNQIDVWWNDALLVTDPVIATTESNRYDSIVVQGAKMMSTFTASTADGTLVPMWTEADEIEYQGIKQESGVYANTSDIVRGQDRWKQVYQLFSLRHDWDWKINGNIVAPAFNDAAYVDDTQTGNYYNDVNRPLQRITRLPKPFTAKGAFAGNIQYQEPQVFATPSPSGAVYPMPPNTRLPSGKSVIRGDLAGSLGGGIPSFSVTMADIAPAIEINAGIPHIMGMNHYDTTHSDSSQSPWYDWKTIIATLCIETDIRPTVKVDLGKNSPWLRTLLIEVPHAEFWWLTTDTITYQNPDLSLNLAGGFATRDDTEILRRVAALAKAWYGVVRTPVGWTEKSYLTEYSIGTMIVNASASIGNWMPINTVITAINYDFLAVTTHIQTGFGELDTAIVLDIPGMSDFASVGRAFHRQSTAIQEIRGRVASIPPKAVTNSTGVVMGQLTAISEEDGTFTVDLYESGTDNDAVSTQTIKGVYPEVANSKADTGSWGVVISAAGKKYFISASNLGSFFLADFFDRPDNGTMNGYWTGSVGSWIIASGVATPIVSGAVISHESLLDTKEYNISVVIGIEDKSTADSNGYIAATVQRTFTLKFGLDGIFQILATTWQAENPASVTAKVNALTAKNTAIADALTTKNTAIADALTTKNTAIAGLPSFDEFVSPRLHPLNTDATQFPQPITPNVRIQYSNGWLWNYNENTDAITEYSLLSTPINNAYNAAVTTANNNYNAAVTTANNAYTQAIANLTQATYINLSIKNNGSTAASVTNQVLKDPYTQEFNLNVAVSGATITVTAGDSVSISYDNITVNRICSAVSVSGIANKHWLKSIKLWKKDKTEPTQTGYGTYRADGFALYKDKYHTATKNSEGVITGYTYNPLA